MGSVIGYQEAHGPVATFETDVAGKIKNLVVDINPVQSGTGGPSPDNIRPISGHTGMTVQRTGKNLLPPLTLNSSYEINTGSEVTSASSASTQKFSMFGNVIVVSYESKLRFMVFGWDEFGNFVGRTGGYFPSSAERKEKSFVLTDFSSGNGNKNYSSIKTIAVRFYAATGTDPISVYDTIKPQLEFSDTATAYEPYQGNIYSITFPSAAGTVYGGTLDIISGQLTVDKTIVDLGTLEWEKSNLTYFKSHSLKGLVETPIDQKTSADIVCSKYQTLTYAQVYVGDTNGIAVIGNTSENDIGLLTINDLALINNTPEEFKASLSGTMLVYKVKSPVSYTLTPQEINTIIGANNIYADTGDTSVIYPKTITPVETISNVNLLELRRNIIAAQAYEKTVDATLNFGTHQVYPTDSIESLRKYLTVVSRGNSTAVTDYTLRGSIDTIGNHQIIIDCHPGIATIQVPVVANPNGILYEWDFTKSLTDERQNYTAILKTGEADEAPGKSKGTTPPIRGNTGVVFNDAQQVLRLLDSNVDFAALMFGKTLQVDVAQFDFVYNNTLTNEPRRALFICTGDPVPPANKGLMLYTRGIILNNAWNWVYWAMRRDNESWEAETVFLSGKNAISGHTIGLYISDNGSINFYVDDEYKGISTGVLPSTDLHGLQIGAGGRPQFGGAFYNARITGVRIYDGNVYNS